MEYIANEYYQKISNYVKLLGYNVEFDNGEPYTCPDINAAFWIGHSRGVDREKCIPNKDKWRFLKFGVLDGVIHPTDRKWQNSLNSYNDDQQPPEEHFLFTDEQKKAIDALVNKIKTQSENEPISS